jgi:hypothetical protein
MSVAGTANQISNQIVAYAPAVIAGVQAAEQAGLQNPAATGADKANAVLVGIQAGSAGLAQTAQPDVAAISALINLCVSIFNALGVFSHKG